MTPTFILPPLKGLEETKAPRSATNIKPLRGWPQLGLIILCFSLLTATSFSIHNARNPKLASPYFKLQTPNSKLAPLHFKLPAYRTGRQTPAFAKATAGRQTPAFAKATAGKQTPAFAKATAGKQTPAFAKATAGKQTPAFAKATAGKQNSKLQSPPTLQLALLKYSGGGDWYNDVNSLKNLAQFCNQNLKTNFSLEYATVEPGSADIFNYPIVYATGHGNMLFSELEAKNLRAYLEGGGFLILNDDYGLDPFVRPSLKKVFPELDLVELPFSHPIYHQKYEFKNGVPKIHEHDGKPAQGFGLIWQGRLVCFYNFETDLGDGWDDIHNDPIALRTKALQMGANIVQYVFSGQ